MCFWIQIGFWNRKEKQSQYILDLEKKNNETNLRLKEKKSQFEELQSEFETLSEIASKFDEEKEELISMLEELSQESADIKKENDDLKKRLVHSLEKEGLERKIREDHEKRKMEIMHSRQKEMKKFVEAFQGIIPEQKTKSHMHFEKMSKEPLAVSKGTKEEENKEGKNVWKTKKERPFEELDEFSFKAKANNGLHVNRKKERVKGSLSEREKNRPDFQVMEEKINKKSFL